MNNWKIYQPKQVLCDICKQEEATLLPVCEVEGSLKQIPVCIRCRDKITKEIKINTQVTEGFYFPR